MAKVALQTGKRLKFRMAKDQSTLTYDLNGNGDYEVFPLQLGSGGYEFSLYNPISELTEMLRGQTGPVRADVLPEEIMTQLGKARAWKPAGRADNIGKKVLKGQFGS